MTIHIELIQFDWEASSPQLFTQTPDGLRVSVILVSVTEKNVAHPIAGCRGIARNKMPFVQPRLDAFLLKQASQLPNGQTYRHCCERKT